jgi:hypothetical protein
MEERAWPRRKVLIEHDARDGGVRGNSYVGGTMHAAAFLANYAACPFFALSAT